MSHPELSYAGVTDWRSGRLSQFAAGTSRADVERIGAELEAERFIFIDEDTEEVLVRSFIRHDGLLKQPRLTVSMVNAYGAIASNSIREVFIHELKRMFDEFPDLKAFENDKVLALLKLPSRPMEEFTLARIPEFTPLVTPLFTPNDDRAEGLRTSTATSTATSPKGDRARKRAQQLPDDFEVTAEMTAWARENFPSVNAVFETQAFKDFHTAKGSVFKDWAAAWRTWIRNAAKFDRGGAVSGKPSPWDAWVGSGS
jgi:hypothetical protein